jgi:hypothetical protein
MGGKVEFAFFKMNSLLFSDLPPRLRVSRCISLLWIYFRCDQIIQRFPPADDLE